MADKVLLEGVYLPLTVPFDREGRLNAAKLAYNVARASLTPAAGMVALLPEFEAETLSDEESREVLRVVGGTAAAEKVLLAGVTRGSVRSTLEMVAEAAAAGFDAVLVGAPTGWPRMVAEGGAAAVELYLQAVADGSSLPVVLLSEAAPGYALSVDAMAAMARHWNVMGVVDSALSGERYAAIAAATKDVRHEVPVTTVFAAVTARMQRQAASDAGGELISIGSAASQAAVALAPKAALKTRRKGVGFQILAGGGAGEMVERLQSGANGVMPRLAACAPQGCHEAFAAWKDGDTALALEKQERLRTADAVVERLGVAAVKAGCDRNSYYGGAPRLPRIALTAVQRVELETALAATPN